MRCNACSLMAAALVVGVASAATAQGGDRGLIAVSARPVRAGFFITVGLGDGLEQYKDTGYPQYSPWLSSPAGVIRIGGTATPNVRVGAEVFGWRHSYYDGDPDVMENVSEDFTAFLLDVQLYPSVRSGFYVKGGIGLAHSGTSYQDEGDVGGNGFAFSGGAGYDIPLSRSVSIAPIVDYYQSHFGNPSDVSNGGYSYTEHVLNIGASITFQSSGRRYR